MRGPSVSEIAQALNDDPARWAPIIIGELPNKGMSTSRELRFYAKGGLRVHVQGPKKGKFSHYGHDGFGDMLELIAYIKKVSNIEAIKIAKELLGLSDGAVLELKPRRSDAELQSEQAEENEKRIRAARFIWSKTSPRIAPEALAYLANRAITTVAKARPEAVRYRKLDRYSLEKMGIEEKGKEPRFPNGLHALVFGATTADGTVGAVQQIILDGDKKADIENKKRSNGLMEGAAVRLGAVPADELHTAEGPETGLSCWQSTDMPTWILLGASNLTRIPVPDQVKTIRHAAELDPTRTGTKAALQGAYFWMRKGKDFLIAMPRVPSDMNDVHRQFGDAGVREDMANALKPERNPFRDAQGNVLSEDAQNDLPILFTYSAEDAVAAWLSTGLGSIPLLKEVHAIGHYVPEGVRKVLIILNGDQKEPEYDLPKDTVARVLRLDVPLDQVYKAGGAEAVRRLLKLHAAPGKRQPLGVEQLALNHGGKVIMTTGKGAADAARELFPGAAVLGISPSASSEGIEWSILAGREVLIAPANREEHILAAEQVANDVAAAGAASVRLLRWPSIAPMKGGWRARGKLPDGYDLRWLVAEGWKPADADILLRLSEDMTASAKSAA